MSGSKGTLERLVSLVGFGDELWYEDVRRVDLWSLHTKLGREFLRSKGFEDAVSTSKEIPGWVFTASDSFRLSFLQGLMDTDGCLLTADYGTVSLALAKGVQRLLNSVGILSSVVRKRGLYKGELHLSWRVNLDRFSLRKSKLQLGLTKDWSVWTQYSGPSVGTRGVGLS